MELELYVKRMGLLKVTNTNDVRARTTAFVRNQSE